MAATLPPLCRGEPKAWRLSHMLVPLGSIARNGFTFSLCSSHDTMGTAKFSTPKFTDNGKKVLYWQHNLAEDPRLWYVKHTHTHTPLHHLGCDQVRSLGHKETEGRCPCREGPQEPTWVKASPTVSPTEAGSAGETAGPSAQGSGTLRL